MRHSCFAAFLLLVLPFSALASKVADVRCQQIATNESFCQIQLEGEVLEGERLYLTGVNDSDQLYWDKIRLGGTGMLFEHFFPGSTLSSRFKNRFHRYCR
jgi:hypothetical protein